MNFVQVALRGSVSLLFTALFLVNGCTARPEEIKTASETVRPSDQEVDHDPWTLLPSGAVGFVRTDQTIWASEFASELSSMIVDYVPLAQDGGIQPERDIELVVGAIYASVQTDAAFVAQGQFKPEGFEAAAAKSATAGQGRAVSTVQFAGETMYVTEQAALAVLTPRTLVFGTQLGVRRVLEVVEEGRMKRALPSWFESLLKQSGAQLQLGMDLEAQPVPAVLRTKLTFLNHLRAARLVGNYKGGGVHLAGSLTFDTPQAATDAEQQLNSAEEQLDQYRLVMHALQMPAPFRSIASKAIGKDAQFTTEIEPEAIAFGLTKGSALLTQIFTEE